MSLMEYYRLFTDAWRLMKKHYSGKLSDEWCAMVILEANQIADKYDNNIFARRLFGLILDELEMIARNN